VSDAKRLKALEDENAKLKKLLAEAMLDNAMLKDIASKKMVTPAARREAVAYQTQNAPAPAKDPNCKVFLPDNVFMSHHDQFRCFR